MTRPHAGTEHLPREIGVRFGDAEATLEFLKLLKKTFPDLASEVDTDEASKGTAETAPSWRVLVRVPDSDWDVPVAALAESCGGSWSYGHEPLP